MSDETNQELPRLTAAWNELDRLCKGERKFTMCIPVQSTDTDIVIGDALRFAQETIAESITARRVLMDLIAKQEAAIQALSESLGDMLSLIDEHGDRAIKAHATRILAARETLRKTK